MKRNRIQEIFLTTLLLSQVTSCTHKKHSEEHSDRPSPSNTIECPGQMSGKLDTASDKDFYRILPHKGKIPQSRSITVTGLKGHNLALKISEAAKLIKSADDYPKNKGERLDNIPSSAREQIIEITQSTQEHTGFYRSSYPSEEYTLSCHTEESPTFDKENNDNFTTAQTIPFDTIIQGTHSPFYLRNKEQLAEREELLKILRKDPKTSPHDIETIQDLDIDFYRLEGSQKKKKLQIHLSSDFELDGILLIIERSPQRTHCTIINSHQIGETEQLANLIISPKSLYYIGVTAIPHEYKTQAQKAYRYHLSITETFFHGEEEESEHNDDCQQISKTRSFGEITGYLSPHNDRDCYKFSSTEASLTQPSTIDITLTGVHNLDLMLILYDDAHRFRKAYNSGGRGEDEQIINYNIQDMQHFYIIVQGAAGATQENIHSPYFLRVKQSSRQNEEIEPNDYTIGSQGKTWNQATPLELTQKIFGRIDPQETYNTAFTQKSDWDVYTIELKYNTRYTLRFQGIEGKALQVMMYQSDSYPVKSFKKIETRTSKVIRRKIFETPQVAQSSDSAKYYIEIRSQSGEDFRGEKYQLSIHPQAKNSQ